MRITRLIATMTAFSIAFASAALAAPNSTQAPPPSAAALSGSDPKGDPSGAVRALGSGDGDQSTGGKMVTVPKLGGEGKNETGHVPAGTTR